ncbi:MAG: hydroxymethylbilane synthase [Promethearchaeota archaeon]
MKEKLIIGTRGSKLAIIQAEEIISELKAITDKYTFELKIIKTHADKFNTTPIHKLGKKGVFVKEIDKALLNGEIDVSVHSMKDLPTNIPEGITLAAIPKRKTYRDVLYSRESKSLNELKSGSIIGTGSFRRRSQMLFLRKDVKVRNIRGNVDTRIKKVDSGDYDAIVIAGIGVQRLNLHITTFKLPDQILPAAGQGALAVETQSDNEKILDLLRALNHQPSYFEVMAENSFIKTFGGGCQVPIGVLGKIKGNLLHLSGEILDLEGTNRVTSTISGNPEEYLSIGKKLVRKIQDQGGSELLEKIKELE